MTKEIWRNIDGYDKYQISNTGRVKSLNNRKPKILNPTKNSHGYLLVSLSKRGKRKSCKVHRLVAMAFIPNYENKPAVNHKDENKENNNVSNLEWCTLAYNTAYSKNLEKAYQATRKAVVCYKKREKIVFSSITEAAKTLDISRSSISNCLSGRSLTAGGFNWRYAF